MYRPQCTTGLVANTIRSPYYRARWNLDELPIMAQFHDRYTKVSSAKVSSAKVSSAAEVAKAVSTAAVAVPDVIAPQKALVDDKCTTGPAGDNGGRCMALVPYVPAFNSMGVMPYTAEIDTTPKEESPAASSAAFSNTSVPKRRGIKGLKAHLKKKIDLFPVQMALHTDFFIRRNRKLCLELLGTTFTNMVVVTCAKITGEFEGFVW